MSNLNENEISKIVIGAAIEVHKKLGGPGLLEKVYETALCHELQLQGLIVARQIQVPIVYKDLQMEHSLYLDILVNEKVIIEVKAVERNHSVHKSQLLTYLRLSNLKLGLVINFGEELVKDGIHRVANKI